MATPPRTESPSQPQAPPLVARMRIALFVTPTKTLRCTLEWHDTVGSLVMFNGHHVPPHKFGKDAANVKARMGAIRLEVRSHELLSFTVVGLAAPEAAALTERCRDAKCFADEAGEPIRAAGVVARGRFHYVPHGSTKTDALKCVNFAVLSTTEAQAVPQRIGAASAAASPPASPVGALRS